MFIKFPLSVIAGAMFLMSFAFTQGATSKAKVPEVLGKYLAKDKPVMGEVGVIVPPKEISKYIEKVKIAALKDKAWYKEFSKKNKPGLPLPWHEKLGLTKDEYNEYLKLWGQRQFKAFAKVVLRLEEPNKNEWMIRASGVGMPISLLHYFPEKDIYKSTNGEMQRIADIDATKESILGAWKGHEWKLEKNTEFINMKENLAIGQYNDGKYCLLIYRIMQPNVNYDKSLIIRFAPPKKK